MRESNWVSFLLSNSFCFAFDCDICVRVLISGDMQSEMHGCSVASIEFRKFLYFSMAHFFTSSIKLKTVMRLFDEQTQMPLAERFRTMCCDMFICIHYLTIRFDENGLIWTCARSRTNTHTHTCQQYTFPFADLDNGIKCHCTII